MSQQHEQALAKADLANQIWRLHATLDAVYGTGFCKRNPHIVAQFMQAFALQTQAEATRDLALEVATIREILASGEGGFTVGIETPIPT